MTIDYLIIGQGLAGSLLAWELLHRGCKVVIVDNGLESASQVAAGLINPITGLRFVKTADVDSLLPAAKIYYTRLSDFFAHNFYHEQTMLRIFRNPEESNNCKKRLTQTGYRRYLGDITEPGHPVKSLLTPFGYLEQKQTGYLLTRPLLTSLKKFFIARACYRSMEFDYRGIRLGPFLGWQDIMSKQIIFCDGYRASHNPWFAWLPWQPVKGEILTLAHGNDLPGKILNYGNWLIPLNAHTIKIGASFDRNCIDNKTTQQVRDALLKSLQEIAPQIHTTLIDQQAGIRPCTQDRQPFIGQHLHHPQLAIFNGFGAKGSLRIPWYAQHFADVLLKNVPLLKTCNIRRYETYFTGQCCS